MSEEGSVTALQLAALTGVAACDQTTIRWAYAGSAGEFDMVLIKIFAASDNQNMVNLTEQVQTITFSHGTEYRLYEWPKANVPPGQYRLFIQDSESMVNASSPLFNIDPPRDGKKDCYKHTDISQPVPLANANSGNVDGLYTATSDTPKPKSSTVVPSVIVPIIVILFALLCGWLCWRRRNRKTDTRRWHSFNAFVPKPMPGTRDASKDKRRKKDKFSVALPSAPTSAASRQAPARQLNETDLGPFGFVSQETDSYPMNDSLANRRTPRPPSYRSATSSVRPSPNGSALKDYMLYDSQDSDGSYEDDGMEDDENFKVVHGRTLYDPNRGSLLPAGVGKMLVVPQSTGRGNAELADPLVRYGDGSGLLAQSRPRSTKRGRERPPRDEEEMGILSSPPRSGRRSQRDSSTSYAYSTESGDLPVLSSGSQAHMFTDRRGYGESEGYGDAPALATSTFALRPPNSARTRQHHHEAHLGASPSSEQRSRPLTSGRRSPRI